MRTARTDGLDWYVFDVGALLDRLATRRYVADPAARPPGWEPYPLPPVLAALDPVPNTRFFLSGPQGRVDGGLFALDGAHPTTIGYGIIAQEAIRIMELAGAVDGPVEVDFARILAADTLLSDPPSTIMSTLDFLGWLDQLTDWARRVLPFGR